MNKRQYVLQYKSTYSGNWIYMHRFSTKASCLRHAQLYPYYQMRICVYHSIYDEEPFRIVEVIL